MVGSETSQSFKCVVVGDGAVGKTSMLLSYTTRGYLSDYMPTIFDSFPVTMACEDDTFKVTLVDTAGQETYDRIRTLTYYDADVFILCFSLIEPSSFENLSSRWLTELKHYRPQTKFMVVGTHLDIREKILEKEGDRAARAVNRKEQTFITRRKAAKWAKRNNAVCYVECSSLTGEGVDEVFQMALCHVVAPKKKNKRFRRFFWKVISSGDVRLTANKGDNSKFSRLYSEYSEPEKRKLIRSKTVSNKRPVPAQSPRIYKSFTVQHFVSRLQRRF